MVHLICFAGNKGAILYWMYILENVPLNTYSTMRLGGQAAFLSEASTRNDIVEGVAWSEERGLPLMVIGEGSNIIWDDDGFPGLVLVNKIEGVEVTGEFGASRYVTAGAGVHWDSFVAQTVEMGLTGIEFLSLIPGTVGATPIQNVGAYGAEVSQTIATIEAYDSTNKKFVTLRAGDCAFGYRTSRFKTTDKGRFLITSITFALEKAAPRAPFYAALQEYISVHSVTDITSQAVRDAVIAIRSSKLPDPAVVANNGSFFANPIISSDAFLELHDAFPEAPHWDVETGVKLSAAWLIEQAGFKDFHDPETGMGTWPNQPLVLVNEGAKTTAQLKVFKQKIIDAVHAKFSVTLEQEPELV